MRFRAGKYGAKSIEELTQRRSGGTQRCTEKRKPTPHLPLKQEVFITANSVNLCVFSVALCVSSSLLFFASFALNLCVFAFKGFF
jgi:hypothetical protein